MFLDQTGHGIYIAGKMTGIKKKGVADEGMILGPQNVIYSQKKIYIYNSQE